jgi:hypothetical protein
LSSLLQVSVYVTHNLLNVLVQIANKMGFKKNSIVTYTPGATQQTPSKRRYNSQFYAISFLYNIRRLVNVFFERAALEGVNRNRMNRRWL